MPSSASSTQLIPFVTLTNWVRAAALCNINIEAVFREVGIDAARLHPETATVSIDQMRRLMAICCVEARAKGAQHFPFALGETFAFEYLSDVETYLTTSPTLRAGLPVLDWVRVFVNPVMRLSVVEQGEHSRLLVQLEVDDESPESALLFAEGVFATILKFGRMLLGEPLPFLELEFKYAAPAHRAQCEAFFQMPIRYGAADSAIVFETTLLDRPLRGAFPTLHQLAEQRVQQRLAMSPKRTELVAAIERAFTDHPALFGQSVDAMALRLGLHPRTLQRRLEAEGLAFSAILDAVRRDQARRWLTESEVPLAHIADILGLADQAVLCRNCARWFGRSPSAIRSLGLPTAATKGA